MGNGYDYGVRKKSTLHLLLRMCAGIQILSRCWPAYPGRDDYPADCGACRCSHPYQSSEGIHLPDRLRTLMCGRHFCQNLEGIHGASILQSTFGDAFNWSLEGAQLPSSLRSLTCGRHFCQSLEGVQLASSLQSLTFGHAFNRRLEGIQLPSSLRSLSFGYESNQSLEGTQVSSCPNCPAACRA
ncbi:fnkA [Symbiodinium natans]|uniref:FnkA protein n=1 Tax=Symbiodinium natans TaxID=878477 RepID=A0A812NY23_9DINO|nr:fnkA [Symbiodinium natans]